MRILPAYVLEDDEGGDDGGGCKARQGFVRTRMSAANAKPEKMHLMRNACVRAECFLQRVKNKIKEGKPKLTKNNACVCV